MITTFQTCGPRQSNPRPIKIPKPSKPQLITSQNNWKQLSHEASLNTEMIK